MNQEFPPNKELKDLAQPFLRDAAYIIRRFRNRFKDRRRDRLKLWIGLLVSALVPILLCWIIPNLVADQRHRNMTMASEATQMANDAFNAEYATLLAYCGDGIPAGEPMAPVPPSPRVVVARHGKRDVFQDNLPAGWQPLSPDDVSVVVCLGSETAREVEACPDGTMPDLSEFTRSVNMGSSNSPGRSVEVQAHLLRYAADVTVYDAVSGQIIAQTTLWGSEPSICTNTEGDLSGERMTGDVLLDWLVEILGRVE